MDLASSEYGPVAGCSEVGDKLLGPVKGGGFLAS